MFALVGFFMSPVSPPPLPSRWEWSAPLNLASVLERATEVAEDVARPNAPGVDEDARWPEKALRSLQESGLGGLVVPADAEGLGLGLLALARVCEVLGAACASTGLCFGMHAVGSAVIAAKATPDHVERFLAPIAAGRHLTTLALSEPGTGSNFYVPEARLESQDSDGFTLTGTKTFVTNGGYADSYVVSAVATEARDEPGLFSMVTLTREMPGIEWGAEWAGLGMRGNQARTMHLRGVRLLRRDLLGEEGDEIWYVFNVIAPYFLVAMAGTYLGIAAAAFREARDHLATRSYSHSGRTAGSLPVLQHRLGTLWAQVERTRRLIYAAAAEGDAGGQDALIGLLSAKAEVADCAVGVVNEAMTLVGGRGYRDRSPLERHLRDARAAHVMAPTTDMLRTWTGRALLGLPLLRD